MHKSTKELKLTKDEKDDLKVIYDAFWQEDIDVRQQLLLKWRRLKFFWNNITNVWYDSVAHNWRIFDGDMAGSGNPNGNTGQDYYDQKINVFRAYLESIIAALSVTVPPVKCYPDDAENSPDIETAKAGDKIAELIYRHNDAPLLWIHGLFVYMTEGFIAAHTTTDYKKEYGKVDIHEYDEELETHQITTCPNCQYEIANEIITPEDEEMVAQTQEAAGISPIQEGILPTPGTGIAPTETIAPTEEIESEIIPDEMDMSGLEVPQIPQDANAMSMMGQDVCPSCGELITPEVSTQNEIKKIWVGTTSEPKGRVKNCAYGGLNIKIPLYARSQEEVFYLFYSYEEHYVQAIEKFPDLHEELSERATPGPRGYDDWEQWARLSTEYRNGSYPIDNVTCKTGWFKPAAYNKLEKARANHWRKKYPNGICATYINDLFACAKEQELDKHWTLGINPLSDYIQNDPVAMLLTSIQEITNDLISLRKQTIEHGVGLTFVDPSFIDLNAYGQTEVLPGSMIPTKTISGNKKLADGIYEVKTATLSGEVTPFANEIQQLGQLVSGAQPALFGGQLEGSETASEYSMSKNQAQARLGTTWTMFRLWWKNVFGKAIPLYISLIQTDERDVKRRKDGSFINVLIRKAELAGTIGRVELEANENIPLTWSQRKDVVMQLLQSSNPQLLQMLMSPENLDILREAIGINDFYVIGEDDRDKQYSEILSLLNTEPIMTGDPMMPEVPSIEVDEIMDNHVIQFEICRKWAVSEAGQLARIENEPGYKNVLLHAKQHLMILNMGDGAPPANPDGKGAENQEKPNELSNKEAPIQAESDLKVV